MIKKINPLYFLADAKEDLKEISAQMGCECFVIKEACEYKSTSDGEWVKQTHIQQVDPNEIEIDLIGYATEDYVNKAVGAIEVPKVEGLASEEYVKEAVKELSTKEYVDNLVKGIELPSVEGLASEEYVNEAIKTATHMDKDYGEVHMFGLMVDSTDGKTLIEAMYEKGKGMYNFHVEKGSPGLPEAVVEKNSSCRGICCVDTLKPTGWYGWIIMFDQDGDMYVQYIRNSEPKGWKTPLLA